MCQLQLLGSSSDLGKGAALADGPSPVRARLDEQGGQNQAGGHGIDSPGVDAGTFPVVMAMVGALVFLPPGPAASSAFFFCKIIYIIYI